MGGMVGTFAFYGAGDEEVWKKSAQVGSTNKLEGGFDFRARFSERFRVLRPPEPRIGSMIKLARGFNYDSRLANALGWSIHVRCRRPRLGQSRPGSTQIAHVLVSSIYF